MPRRLNLIALAAAWLICTGAASVEEAALPNSRQEARAQALFAQLRCIVCEAQSLADSPVEVARDLRMAVRRMIREGKSEEEIRAALAAHYGDAVLMKPPFAPHTYLLWFAPIILLFTGAAAIVAYIGAGRMDRR